MFSPIWGWLATASMTVPGWLDITTHSRPHNNSFLIILWFLYTTLVYCWSYERWRKSNYMKCNVNRYRVTDDSSWQLMASMQPLQRTAISIILPLYHVYCWQINHMENLIIQWHHAKQPMEQGNPCTHQKLFTNIRNFRTWVLKIQKYFSNICCFF